MKKICIALVALTSLFSCNKKDSNHNLTINGKIEGLRQGTLYIQTYADSNVVTLDSIKIEGNSNFESHLTINEPEMLYLTLNRGISKSMDNVLPFFAEPGTMTIETSLKSFYSNAKINGSENNDLYEDFIKLSQRYSDEENKTLSLTLLAKKVNDPIRVDSLIQRADKLKLRRYLDIINFAVNNGKHEVAPYVVLTEIPDANLSYLDTIQKSMSPEVAKSKYGKMLMEYIEKRKETEQK